MSDDGTVDITNLVESLRTSFVRWGVAYVFGLEASTPGLEWVALPILSTLDKWVVEDILNVISKAEVMQAFFLNTAIRKASQADDYLSAIDAKNAVSPNASNDDYEKAERAEILAFNNFVRITN